MSYTFQMSYALVTNAIILALSYVAGAHHRRLRILTNASKGTLDVMDGMLARERDLRKTIKDYEDKINDVLKREAVRSEMLK